jgi:hypothetical protein
VFQSETNKLQLANQHEIEKMMEHENKLIRKESKLENAAKYSAVESITTGLFGNLFGGILDSPKVKSEMAKKVHESVKNQALGEK